MIPPLVIAAISLALAIFLVRYFRQAILRRRIVRGFKSYVDPGLVKKVINDPDAGRMQTRTVDVTVVMTNLTDSVGLFERLGDHDAVELLNLYLSTMTPIIRRHRGFINKLMGDRILFFFNAPVESDPEHPVHAVETVLEMQAALDDLNQRLDHVGKPRLKMRAGISSGMASIGDVGSPEFRDYTVVGAVADRASRLEQLCKQTGTRNLISVETSSRLGERFRLNAVKLPADSETPVLAYEAVAAEKGIAV
jgi:adenylate cyclase